MEGKYASLSSTDELSGIKQMPRVSELRQIIGLALKSCDSQNCHGETDSSSSLLVLSEDAYLWLEPARLAPGTVTIFTVVQKERKIPLFLY